MLCYILPFHYTNNIEQYYEITQVCERPESDVAERGEKKGNCYVLESSFHGRVVEHTDYEMENRQLVLQS